MKPASRKLDPFAIVVRGAVGMVAGFLVGLPLALRLSDDGISWGVLLACAVLGAVLAIQWGDRFWEALGRWVHHWWPW